MNKKVIALFLGVLATSKAIADDKLNLPELNTQDSSVTTETISQYFSDGEEGWFWYNELPPEVQEEIIKTIQRIAESKQDKPEPAPLSSKWFRENFQSYMDKAMSNPYDREAMRNYLYMEKYMRDISETFTHQRAAMIAEDPFLDESRVSGKATFAHKNMSREGVDIGKKLMKELANSIGIYFFYRSDCAYCHKQAPLIKLLAKRHGFTIKPVSLDGKKLPGNGFDDYLIDSGQAKSLGIQVVPSIYIFDRDNQQTTNISQGLQSLKEIERRIILAARRMGYITEEELRQTRGKGLYPRLDGSKNTQFDMPENAPDEFKKLYMEMKNEQKGDG